MATEESTEESVEQQWNAVWGRPIQRVVGVGRRVYNEFFLSLLKANAPRGARLLEVGCGTGSLLADATNIFGSCIGFDISEAALVQCSERGRTLPKPFRLVRGDCFQMPFADNSFDLVWSQGLLEHFDNRDEILREKFRVCRPGGKVLAGVPYAYSYHQLWYWVTRPTLLRPLWPWTDQEFLNLTRLENLGRSVAPDCSAYMMTPSIGGIAVLELRKPPR